MAKVVIIGATGLVGSNLLGLLICNNKYADISIIARTLPMELPQRVEHIPLNDGEYSFSTNIDIAYCCLGTTMKKAGSKQAFLKVDLDMVVDFAKKAKDAGVKRFAVVSSIGANAKSRNFYLSTKGKVEEQLKALGFERLVIVQPSLLLGKRDEKRFGEDMGKVLYSVFKFMFIGPLKKYRGIQASDVAKAMIVLTEQGMGTVTVESNMLQDFSNKYQDLGTGANKT
ncbi:MAG: oxidoreductase [Bacteroidales bacterium]|nr:oxidoreductase [Bacteroidales bacterium]